MIRKLFTKIALSAGRLAGRFITFHTRPMFEAELTYEGKETPGDARCAIVIQGPIRHQDDFTFETVKIYRRHYPASTIILSTWVGEDVSKFEQFKGERFKIVLSEKPKIPAPGNVNMQIISTQAGIEEAFEIGLEYIAKTRTDQRIYSADLLDFLQKLQLQFPVINTKSQTQRIIGTAAATSKVQPYQFSDLFMFGKTSDMKIYWNTELLLDPAIKTRGYHVEGYLFKQFLAQTDWNVKGTVEDFMVALGERFIIVDNELMDIYWPKYISLLKEHRIRTYLLPELQITFKTWLNETYIPARVRQSTKS